MNKHEELKQKQARMVELRTIMASSDAHAAKCAKLDKKFQTQYPEDYAAYVAANEEYQAVEQRVKELEFEISLEEEPMHEVEQPAESEREEE
jgi:conjugal transfer/entry exclusion protein